MRIRFLAPILLAPIVSVALPAQTYAAGAVSRIAPATAAPALITPVKKKKAHVSGSVGTNGASGNVSVGNGPAKVSVNSNGKASVSVKPKGSKVRVGVNSKGKIRIGF